MLPALYAVTLFVGATLLFLVQPLVGKLLLPLVGGTPGVWNACMVFFQAVLLGGYLYAHRSITQLGVRRQAGLHLALLVVVLLAFKIAAAATGSPVPVFSSLVPADQDYPIAGVVTLLAAAVGVPFFVLSTTSPLLQRWFAATGHPAAKDPYFLYAASNAGSLLGLLAYPLLVEPRPEFTLAVQRWAWAGGVLAYLALVLVCALTVLRTRNAECGMQNEDKNPAPDLRTRNAEKTAGPEFRNPQSAIRIARWVGLAALPSSLMLGVTTHVSTDLAPVPLLWVVPLALYLVSFIVVFARWPDPVHRAVGRVTPMLLLFVVLSLLTGAVNPLGLIAGLHLAAFFGVCLVCHGELAKDRPPPEQLTAFYLWMSLGGVLGGMANALVAPVVFHRVGMVEYPLALALAALVRPRSEEADPGPPLRAGDVALVLVLLGLAVGLVLAVPRLVSLPPEPNAPDAMPARLLRGGLMFGLPAVAAFALVRRPARYALALAALLAAGTLDPGQLGATLHMERNFFGVVRVTRSADGRFVNLIHGTTLHGQQRADEPGPPRPLTYYHEKGPVGSLFRSLPADRVRRVAVVGLGIGSVAAYAKPGQEWTFYEIDPAVVRIAHDPRFFTFLSTCRAAKCDVVLGDARRQLTRAPDGEFDVIILDAFSSDSIPVHLLTREAVRLYVQKLAPAGVLAVHVSNAHLDLPPLVNRLAADHDPPLAARYRHDHPVKGAEDGKEVSQWMVLARTETDLGPMARGPYWEPVRGPPRGPVWRDDFANLLWAWKRKDTEE
ncbi:MAG: spermidine synthase [Gemmataceae bacterium]|nr:spermidine synthase [Gemmataceae bacterium]